MDEAWILTVTNLSKGWELTTHAGEQLPDLDAANPVLLEDPFKGSWAYDDYPAGFQPRQAEVSVRVLDAATLLDQVDTDPGDTGVVSLTYNGHAINPATGLERTVTNTWFHVSGYFDEPEVKADGRGLTMQLALVDPTAQLAEIPVSGTAAWAAESLGARLNRICQWANINLLAAPEYASVATMGLVTVSNKGALSLLRECLDSAQYAGSQLVLRGGIVGHEVPSTLTDGLTTVYEGDPDWNVPGKPFYWIDRVERVSYMKAPYRLVSAHDLGAPGAAAGVGLYVAQREPVANLYLVTGGAALDADDVLASGTQWAKRVDAAVNQVKLVGVDAAGEELSVVASYTDLVKANGPHTRVVQTQRYLGGATPIADAQALLPDRASAVPDWTADQFTFTTKNLSTYELGYYSGQFYPDLPASIAGGFAMQLPVAIVDVEPKARLAGGSLAGVLTGATFQISKGVLSIVGQLRNELLRPAGTKINLVTYADLRTEHPANDPARSWSEFTYRSTAATPYLTSDKVWDADQAHPTFGHEQLTYRDLRLIGVT